MITLNKENKLFPEKLKKIKPEIKEIYVEGKIENLNKFGIAIIGSRNYSKEGEKITNEFSGKLSKAGINIISGLAKGIDSIAHESCIEAKGITIAVLGSGFNYIYPKENEKLYQKILETGGTIISEYSPETKPASKNFPKRNRIISALSDGILVIEGKYRSGTTITAEYGIKQKKPIFSIPHSIYNAYGACPNTLIKKGGILVTNPDEIIEYFIKQGIEIKPEEKIQFDDEILNILSKEILTKEELVLKTNKSISQINQKITILELEGKIEEYLGKGYRIIE